MSTFTETSRGQRWRKIKDIGARNGVVLGGISVIGALLLIFFYLLSIVIPLFSSAKAEVTAKYPLPGNSSASLYLTLEEQNQLGLRVTPEGKLIFFSIADGSLKHEESLPLPTGVNLRDVQELDASHGQMAALLSDDSALVFQHQYTITYPNNRQLITPRIEYPLGQIPLVWASEPVYRTAVRMNNDRLLLAGAVGNNEVLLKSFDKQVSIVDDSVTMTPAIEARFVAPVAVTHLLLSPQMDWLYVVSSTGDLAYYDIRDAANPKLLQITQVFGHRETLASTGFLSGGYSLVFVSARGDICQWFPVRDAENRYQLQKVRSFESAGAAEGLTFATEQRRRGFLTADAKGQVNLYYATSERLLLSEPLATAPIGHIAFAPRATALLLESADGLIRFATLENHHPEISWQALWGKVWYEGYAEPSYTWQSTAANNDFEPKLSLMPLTFGTFKAAVYAMLFAVPFALMGAIYTAYFMSPAMRQWVKPGVEIIQALPSVILGFFAGLWLAPVVEANLASMLGVLLLTPLAVIGFALLWAQLPRDLRQRVPEGWHALTLVPLVLLFGWLCFTGGSWMDKHWLDGGLPIWLDHSLGIDYDQRNSLVVGLAMGFGVIPMIFSIAEDALFSVPKTLSNGSLALGATPWQTLVRVVLPTASPGIFSAIMIGFGRAVGETMIVLMATGNTAIMDFSIFQGLRTLSANIAVEMPESEVGSTHFRVLFLAGLVLFLFTFVFNTLAETVRQRLRMKYGNL